MRCLCLPSYPPHTLDILCCVLCCAYAYAKLGGGGARMPMHALSVLVSKSVCIMHHHPPTLVVCYLCFPNSTSLGSF